MPRLLILSDLWGIEKSQWLQHYTNVLSARFDIQYYDSCALGKVNKRPYQQNHLHQQFVESGIATAVKQLLKIEKAPVSILAFSVGGVIAWQAALQGLPVQQLVAVSSTRLRYETQQAAFPIHLYFGALDSYRPDENWFKNFDTNHTILPQKGHDFYMELAMAELLCKELV